MSTAVRPDPRTVEGRWTVDLRRAGFGQRYSLDLPATEPREEALHRAYALLEQLRGRRLAEPEQRDLFGETTPVLFASALDAWRRQKRSTDGAKRYVDTYARLVRQELGEYQLADFAPPDGTRRLQTYVATLERRGLSGRTIRNRLSTAEQVCRFAVLQGWIASVPLHPAMPPKARPVFRWLTEAMFRALRTEIYRDVKAAQMFRVVGADRAALPLYVARRRMYLSWLFYTGVHHYDADHATSDWLFLDGRAYIRHNHKTSMEPVQFEMPEPLYSDFRELEALQGRTFFPGEQFTGGGWPDCARVMQKAAVKLGFPHGANPSILRRSYAREMFLHGYDVHEVADRMGHVDTRMLREIYTQTPRAAGHPKTRWLDTATAPPSPSGMARVLRLQRGEP